MIMFPEGSLQVSGLCCGCIRPPAVITIICHQRDGCSTVKQMCSRLESKNIQNFCLSDIEKSNLIYWSGPEFQGNDELHLHHVYEIHHLFVGRAACFINDTVVELCRAPVITHMYTLASVPRQSIKDATNLLM